jgi:hypothetical protein
VYLIEERIGMVQLCAKVVGPATRKKKHLSKKKLVSNGELWPKVVDLQQALS